MAKCFMNDCDEESERENGLCHICLNDRNVLLGNAIGAIDYIIDNGVSSIDDWKDEGTTDEIIIEVVTRVKELFRQMEEDD